MNIPRKVRISGIDYVVEQVEHPVCVAGRQCCGDIDYDHNRIRIDVSYGSPTSHVCTLLHEVVHGIVHDRDIYFGEGADEESIVEAFAKGLYQVLRDNPDLTAPKKRKRVVVRK